MIFLVSTITLFLIFFLLGMGSSERYQGSLSDHFDGTHFHNYEALVNKTWVDTFIWLITSKRQPWPSWVNDNVNPNIMPVNNPDEIKITFVNHATFLMQTKNFNILTDPIWSERASPFSWIGPKRVRAPGIVFNELPFIHVVLISHNHYDHMDVATLKKLEQKFHPLFLVPLGNKFFLQRLGIKLVQELDWWQVVKLKEMEVAFLPAHHWSARWFNDRNKTLWGAFGISINQQKIYFAGDTGYAAHFKMIRKRWGKPTIALLPIGAYEPAWFMRPGHLNPMDAVEAHQDLQAKKSIGMHFGTFQLTAEGIDQPLKDLKQALENRSQIDFATLHCGETISIDKVKYKDEHK